MDGIKAFGQVFEDEYDLAAYAICNQEDSTTVEWGERTNYIGGPAMYVRQKFLVCGRWVEVEWFMDEEDIEKGDDEMSNLPWDNGTMHVRDLEDILDSEEEIGYKKIGSVGNALVIYVTSEVKSMGLGRGDFVRVTLEKADE